MTSVHLHFLREYYNIRNGPTFAFPWTYRTIISQVHAYIPIPNQSVR